MHTELSEAIDADQKGAPAIYYKDDKPEGVAVELVDCVIRIFDYFGRMNWDFEDILKIKHDYNKTREYLHGKKY